ncbi:uncharacterized protein LOC115896793 isoform X1 [Rhinopithecus roxellana]|uniref:uncharacterized protein LOC115896793 isoform X1 n=1 Tax=Rhinopithecus roxellana TaxID=61622 RepID=UPI00123749B6|nr:uncharacterized protein LOC115896793 isoform X1 [Rhinopithecus roxellana]
MDKIRSGHSLPFHAGSFTKLRTFGRKAIHKLRIKGYSSRFNIYSVTPRRIVHPVMGLPFTNRCTEERVRRGEGDVKKEAEIGTMGLQAKVPGVFQERRHHQELQVPLPAAFTAAGPARARPGLAAPTPEERRGAGQKLWNTKPSRTQHKSPGAEPRTPVAKPEARTNPSPHTTGHLFYFILFKMLVSGLCIYLGVTQEGHWKSTDLARTEPHVCLGKVALFFQP